MESLNFPLYENSRNSTGHSYEALDKHTENLYIWFAT